MILTFDRQTYGNLLMEACPVVIETEAEYERLLAIAEKLCSIKLLSEEESKLLTLLTTLIEDYEEREYPLEPVAPHEMLAHLMDARDLRQADLVGIIGSSGVVSEIVNGKRGISKAQAKILGEYFHISPSAFL